MKDLVTYSKIVWNENVKLLVVICNHFQGSAVWCLVLILYIDNTDCTNSKLRYFYIVLVFKRKSV
jgi:hypothetical protein